MDHQSRDLLRIDYPTRWCHWCEVLAPLVQWQLVPHPRGWFFRHPPCRHILRVPEVIDG